MSRDPMTEIHFALAEGDARGVTAVTRGRVLASVFDDRRAGYPVDGADPISGVETFVRMTDRFEDLLDGLNPDDWRAPTIRGLDVQGLVGHLIGVEAAFAASVEGSSQWVTSDHVASTQDAALAQVDRDPAVTRSEWATAVAASKSVIAGARDAMTPVRMHGVSFPMDTFLVVRAFELWTHDEDIRRAIGRPVADPDPAVLNRMTDLATVLLPAGVAMVGGTTHDTVRLVLTGPGGGAWDVVLDDGVSRAEPGRVFDTHVTVGAAAFCRVVANRSSFDETQPLLAGRQTAARILFAGAAALALD